MKRDKRPDVFSRFTSNTSTVLGKAWVFIITLLILVIWACTGPLLNFSDTWQLVINTGTTIVTFLMVFIIQNTQNRDTLALNIKLDTIMEKLGVYREELLDAENESEKDLEKDKEKILAKNRRRKTSK